MLAGYDAVKGGMTISIEATDIVKHLAGDVAVVRKMKTMTADGSPHQLRELERFLDCMVELGGYTDKQNTVAGVKPSPVNQAQSSAPLLPFGTLVGSMELPAEKRSPQVGTVALPPGISALGGLSFQTEAGASLAGASTSSDIRSIWGAP
jgi:hypothetical protein